MLSRSPNLPNLGQIPTIVQASSYISRERTRCIFPAESAESTSIDAKIRRPRRHSRAQNRITNFRSTEPGNRPIHPERRIFHVARAAENSLRRARDAPLSAWRLSDCGNTYGNTVKLAQGGTTRRMRVRADRFLASADRVLVITNILRACTVEEFLFPARRRRKCHLVERIL